MDHTAVEAIGKLAVAAERAQILMTKVPAALVNGETVSLEALTGKRAYFRGRYTTSMLSAFTERVNALSGEVFVDDARMHATCYHNLGTSEEPGAADHVSTLDLKASALWTAIQNINSQKISQRDMATWLEEWADHLQTLVSSDATKTSPIAGGIQAVRKIDFNARRTTSHEAQDLSASRSSLESIEASAKGGTPYGFLATVTPYEGFASRDVVLRLGILSDPDNPQLTLRVFRYEALRESLVSEFGTIVRNDLNDVPVHLGTFTP